MAVGIRCADHVTPVYPQKLALTSPTGSGCSVGIVRSRTKATELITNYTPLPAWNRLNPAMLITLLQMSQSMKFLITFILDKHIGIQEKIFMSFTQFLYSFTLDAYHFSLQKLLPSIFMSEYCIIFFMFICIFSYHVGILCAELYY